jgi:hypothetical protein
MKRATARAEKRALSAEAAILEKLELRPRALVKELQRVLEQRSEFVERATKSFAWVVRLALAGKAFAEVREEAKRALTDPDAKLEILHTAIDRARAIPEHLDRSTVLVRLAVHLPDEEREAVLTEALEAACEISSAEDRTRFANWVKWFIEAIGRQNSDLVSSETVQDNPVPGETITPAQARGKSGLRHSPPLRDTAGHEQTRPAETAAQQLALAAQIPVEAARGIVNATVSKPEEMKAASTKLLRPSEKFVSEGEHRANDRSAADAHLLAGDLPASLQPRGQVRNASTPPDEATIAMADDVLAAYADGKRHGVEFSDTEMMFVRASWRVKDAVKPKEPGKRRGRPKAHRIVMHS